MNKAQYRVVKSFLNCGVDPIKFAKLIKVNPIDVMKVQQSSNFEQYKGEDGSFGDLFKQFMGK